MSTFKTDPSVTLCFLIIFILIILCFCRFSPFIANITFCIPSFISSFRTSSAADHPRQSASAQTSRAHRNTTPQVNPTVKQNSRHPQSHRRHHRHSDRDNQFILPSPPCRYASSQQRTNRTRKQYAAVPHSFRNSPRRNQNCTNANQKYRNRHHSSNPRRYSLPPRLRYALPLSSSFLFRAHKKEHPFHYFPIRKDM